MILEQYKDALSFQPSELLFDRFSQEHNVSKNEASEHFEETKKFLFLCATNPDSSFTPSKEIDKMWHTFLLHSKDYVAFCNSLGVFLHHVPSDGRPQTGNYEKTREALTSMFGELNPLYWGQKAGDCDCEAECSNGGACPIV